MNAKKVLAWGLALAAVDVAGCEPVAPPKAPEEVVVIPAADPLAKFTAPTRGKIGRVLDEADFSEEVGENHYWTPVNGRKKFVKKASVREYAESAVDIFSPGPPCPVGMRENTHTSGQMACLEFDFLDVDMLMQACETHVQAILQQWPPRDPIYPHHKTFSHWVCSK